MTHFSACKIGLSKQRVVEVDPLLSILSGTIFVNSEISFRRMTEDDSMADHFMKACEKLLGLYSVLKHSMLLSIFSGARCWFGSA